MDSNAPSSQLRLDIPLPDTSTSRVAAITRWSLEHVSGFKRVAELYPQMQRLALRNGNFCEAVLDTLQIRMQHESFDLKRIPASGPLVVVANHPFGIVDGLVLFRLIRLVRKDVRLMVSKVLGSLPEMHADCIFVDNFGGPQAQHYNSRSLRDAFRWLRNGNVLIVFPAGEVAHLNLSKKEIADPPWNDNVARLIRHAKAGVVTAYFEGSNSPLFHLGGVVHSRLRTLLLLREMLRRSGQTISVKLGGAIEHRRLQQFASDCECIGYLRNRTFLLQHRKSVSAAVNPSSLSEPLQSGWEPIAGAIDPTLVASEIAALPPAQCLRPEGKWPVYYACAEQIPQTLLEIGRLREIAFRNEGEGTGRARDLDRFDRSYKHLFVWNPEAREIVGAYRFGSVEMLSRKNGDLSDLYTQTLFQYDERLLKHLRPALELGRSFVRLEYQRTFSPLMLLWKGIGAYLVRHPHYRKLFGPVSISNAYHPLSKQLIVSYLKGHHMLADWSSLVRAIRPFEELRKGPQAFFKSEAPADLDELSSLVADLENDGKGVAVLLKQYLRLGARFLAFNVDHDFNQAIDGLLVVELDRTDPPMLQKYMGTQEAELFRNGLASEIQRIGQIG